MPRATPFCFQTHPLFCILHLCSADTAQKRRVLGLWCDSYKIPRVPTANAMLYMKWHLAQEGNKKKRKKKRRKKKPLGCFSSLSNKDFSIGCILLWIGDWFTSRFKMLHSGALFLFQGKKLSDCWRKILLAILEGLMHWLGQGKAAEDCSKSLITWECYVIVSFWSCLINTLSWVHLTTGN